MDHRPDSLHAQALVATEDATRLGESLARAFGGVWNAAAGNLNAAAATVDVNAWPDGLRIDAYAASEADLAAAERSIDEALAHSGARPADWRIRPSSVPGAPPAPQPVYNFPHDDHDD